MTASRWLLGLLCIGAMVFPALELSAETDAADLPQKNLTVDLGGGVSMELVLIPPGSFIMGCDKGADDETPAHKVTISKAFYLGKFHVTRQQWKAVMGRDPGKFGDGRHPANNVSWDACQEFLKKLSEKNPGRSFRLPTEAQWEYACRAGSTSDYCYGDDEALLGDYAWYTANSDHMTQPVGLTKPNAWGLYDMHGNVWQWCADHDGDYPAGAVADPSGPAQGPRRILRGGSWCCTPRDCRAGYRNWVLPTFKNVNVGFRVCLDL